MNHPAQQPVQRHSIHFQSTLHSVTGRDRSTSSAPTHPSTKAVSSHAANAMAQPPASPEMSLTPAPTQADSHPKTQATQHTGPSSKIVGLLRKIDSSIESLRQESATQLAETSHSAVELATLIAHQLVGAAIEADSGPIISRLQSLIPQIDASRSITIRLNPADVQAIEQHKLELSPTQQAPIVAADPSINRGNCLVETETGNLLYEWKRHLTAINEELLQTIHQSKHESTSENPNPTTHPTSP